MLGRVKEDRLWGMSLDDGTSDAASIVDEVAAVRFRRRRTDSRTLLFQRADALAQILCCERTRLFSSDSESDPSSVAACFLRDLFSTSL